MLAAFEDTGREAADYEALCGLPSCGACSGLGKVVEYTPVRKMLPTPLEDLYFLGWNFEHKRPVEGHGENAGF